MANSSAAGGQARGLRPVAVEPGSASAASPGTVPSRRSNSDRRDAARRSRPARPSSNRCCKPGQVEARTAGPGTCRRSPGAAGARGSPPRDPPRGRRIRPCRGWRRRSRPGRRPARPAASSPVRAARRTALAATVSAAAIANRAETPERASTCGRLAYQPGEPGDAPRSGSPAATGSPNGEPVQAVAPPAGSTRVRRRGAAGSGCGPRRRSGP